MEGLSLTVIADVGKTQPEILLVKVNVAEPAAIPVITRNWLVASAGLELVQVPPLLGLRLHFTCTYCTNAWIAYRWHVSYNGAIVLLKGRHNNPTGCGKSSSELRSSYTQIRLYNLLMYWYLVHLKTAIIETVFPLINSR